MRHGGAGNAIGRLESWTVGEDALADEANRVIEQRMAAGGRDGLARVALVTDPAIPVVIVTALFGPFRQRHGGRGDHPPAAARQAAKHRIRGLSIKVRHGARKRRNCLRPCPFGGQPGVVGTHHVIGQLMVGHFQNQVMVTARSDLDDHLQRPVVAPLRITGPEPPKAERARPPAPHPVVERQLAHTFGAEIRAHVERDPHAGSPVERANAAKHQRRMRVPRKRQRIAPSSEDGEIAGQLSIDDLQLTVDVDPDGEVSA